MFNYRCVLLYLLCLVTQTPVRGKVKLDRFIITLWHYGHKLTMEDDKNFRMEDGKKNGR